MTYSRAQHVEHKILMGGSIHSNACPDHITKDDVVIFNSDDDHYFGMTTSQLSKHLLLIGGIGCGKTNTFYVMMNQLLEKMATPEGEHDVMFIFDTKGDFKNTFYDPTNPRHAVLGNGRMYQSVTRYWNIYKELLSSKGVYDPEESDLAAKEIATQLFKGTAGGDNQFFETTAADLFAMKLIDTLRRGANLADPVEAERVRNEEWNNQALITFFREATVDAYHDMIDRNKDFQNVRNYLGERGADSNSQSLGILAQLSTVVNSLFVGIFEKAAPERSRMNLSMRSAVRRKGGRVLFIEYDLSIGEKLGPIYRTLFDLALKEALGRTGGDEGDAYDRRLKDAQDKPEAPKGNVYFVIDEFKLLPNLAHIDDALNFGRSLGVKVFAGIQNVHQIYDIYGEERGRALFAGFMNCFSFQTPDPETRQYVAERMGTNYTSIDYRMLEEPQIINRDGHTAEDWDLFGLGIGQACVDIVGVDPFLFHFEEFKRPGK